MSGEVIGQRPAAEGLRRLRSKVSGLIQVLAEARLTCSDAQSLVTVLRSCRDARVVIDVVKLLLSWLTPVAQIGAERSEPGAAPRLRLPSCGAALVARLAELARKSEETLYDTLVDLMHGDSELLRLAALRLLGLLLAAGGTALSPPPAIWPRITHAMGGTPSFSGTTYSALLDTMVGRPHAVTLDPSVLPSDTICNPQFIPTILQLLPRAAPPIQQTALSHLTRLCKARPSNCDAILQQTGVQRLLLLLLRAEAGEGGATGAASATAGAAGGSAVSAAGGAAPAAASPGGATAQAGARLLPLLVPLLHVLHAHALMAREHGWRTLQQTLGLVALIFSEPGAEPAPPAPSPLTARALSRRLLEGSLSNLCDLLPAICTAGYGAAGAAGAMPLWAENVEQLLAMAKRFVLDERAGPALTASRRADAERGPTQASAEGAGEASGPAETAHATAAPGSPALAAGRASPTLPPTLALVQPAAADAAPEPAAEPAAADDPAPAAAEEQADDPGWECVWCATSRLDPADLPLITACLDLLHLLGVAVAAAPPRADWAPVRTAWASYCEAQGAIAERDRPAQGSRWSSRPSGGGAALADSLSLGGTHGAYLIPRLVMGEAHEPRGSLSEAASAGVPAGASAPPAGAEELDPLGSLTEDELEAFPRCRLEGGLYWLALSFLLRAISCRETSHEVWEVCTSRLGRLLQLLQPATHGAGGAGGATPKERAERARMRRARLQSLCGKWQAGLLERQCQSLLPDEEATGAAPSQGAMLHTLAWVHASLAEAEAAGAAADAADEGGAQPGLAARRAGLVALAMGLMPLLEPYPFGARVAAPRELYTAAWRTSCAPLLRQVVRLAGEGASADAESAAAAVHEVWARLRVAHERQTRREDRELAHGSDAWQDRLVVLLEEEMGRRDELSREQASQERMVARLWLTLTRRLTHQRAPWAPSQRTLEAGNIWRLSKWENSRRQRHVLKRVSHGTRHREASKHRVKGGEGEADTPPTLPAIALQMILPTGVALAKLCEGSDGEGWEVRDTLRGAAEPPDGSAGLTPREAPAGGGAAGGAEETARKPIFEAEAELVTPTRVTPLQGTLQLYASRVTFLPAMATYEKQADEELAKWEVKQRGERPVDKPPREKEWSLAGLYEVHRRRYLLRASALELFFRDATPVFFNLRAASSRRKLLGKLRSHVPRTVEFISPTDGRWVQEACARWQAGELSNFDYLQRLNSLAGRTYNDLNQYPVFPWVLSDYTSPTLDLSDPNVYRDLSKPMGAQRADRAQEIVARYEHLKQLDDEDTPPPFHYGSHYSSAAIVLFYLTRTEPFTTLAVRLQGGFFDHADRMFHSIGSTFANATSASSDVKELTPELYYNPEVLRNLNGVDLGTRQDGQHLDDVCLPPWASSPAEFIALHRAALESDLVSAHLHEWVDLVFGAKQRGAAAEQAVNVFYHLTYEGAVDLDAIADPRQRASTEAQISNFGNTPSQLLTKPHPPRPPPEQRAPALTLCTAPAEARLAFEGQLSAAPVLALAARHDRIVSVGADRRLSTHRWLSNGLVDTRQGQQPYAVAAERAPRQPFGVPFVEGLSAAPAARFAASADGRHLFSSGYWDHSVKCSTVADGRTLQSLRAHTDVVSCLSLSEDGATLVTGSRDTTLMVWPVTAGSAAPLADKPRHVLHGHDDEVSCVAASSEMSLIVSGSRDGSAIVYTLRSGQYVRTVAHPAGLGLDLVAMSSGAALALYCAADASLHACTVNQRHGAPPAASAAVGERLSALCYSSSGEVLLSAGERGRVTLRRPSDLSVLYELHAGSEQSPGGAGPLRCLSVSADEDYVLAGTQGGCMLVWALRSTRQIEQSQRIEGMLASLTM